MARTPWELGYRAALAVVARRYGLLFVELWQRKHRILGLVDSGSEINLIGEGLLDHISYASAGNISKYIRGVGGARSQVLRWVSLTLELENGVQYIGPFAVLRELGTAMILGLPFLRGVNAVLDFNKNILDMGKDGSVLLHPAAAPQPAPSVSAVIRDGGLELDVVPRESDDEEVDPPDESNKGEETPEEVAEKAASSEFLSESQRSETKAFLLHHSSLWKDGRRGVTNVLEFDMDLVDERPIACRPRRFALKEQQVIDKEVDSMLETKVVEHSRSPFASEIVLVKKKTGDWRICIDFRQVNARTIQDKFPLPRVQDLLRAVRGATHFVSLDLRAGYWQIPVSKRARKYTAFRTSRGLLQFLVMPFGLVNAPAVFQRLMATVLGDLYWDGVIVYLDDVLVFGSSYEECMARLEVVFDRLARANLTLRLDKCVFFPSKIKYLGFMIEKGHLYPDLKKVATLDRLTTPRCARDVRSLLGFTGFYRMFVPKYAEKAEPLTRLLSRKQPFAWGPEQDQALAQIVEDLKDATLKNPLEGENYRVYCDASGLAVAGMLCCSVDREVWSPVEFVSYVLNETQRKWPSFEKEVYAIVRSVKAFDFYLCGMSFLSLIHI